MDHTTQQPIELHCRAVLHLSPEQFTIRGLNIGDNIGVYPPLKFSS